MASTLDVEILCGHHQVEDFDCGDPEYNLALRCFVDRALNRDTQDFHAVVVADDRGVVGIATTMDVEVDDYESRGLHVEGICLFYTLLAVDKRYRRTAGVVQKLLDEIDNTRARRFSVRADLVGEVASPDGRSKGLSRYLEKRGFAPLHNDRTLWYRLPDDIV